MTEIKKNMLQAEQKFALYTWFKAQAEAGVLDNKTAEEVAQAATTQMRFYVNAKNIQGAVRATGADWQRRRVVPTNSTITRVINMEAQIANLEAELGHLRQDYAALYALVEELEKQCNANTSRMDGITTHVRQLRESTLKANGSH